MAWGFEKPSSLAGFARIFGMSHLRFISFCVLSCTDPVFSAFGYHSYYTDF